VTKDTIPEKDSRAAPTPGDRRTRHSRYRKSIMLEKQSAIEVMTISRFALQIVARWHSRSGQHHATQNSCVMAAGRDQHEAVSNGLLEGQRPPNMKTDPYGIEHASNSH
jgi:hypothetical protein